MKKRLSLLLVAAMLAVTTLSLGLTNTLTATDSLFVTASLAKDGDFGVTLSSPSLDPVLYPDQDYPFVVKVTSANSIPAYVIAKVELPPDFVVDGSATFAPSGWTPLVDQDGKPVSDVYYYGSDGETTVLRSSTTLMSSIRLAENVEVLPKNAADVDYTVSIQVWAFQKTSETEVMSPGALWAEVDNP